MNKKIAQGLIVIGILLALYGIYVQFFASGYGNYSQSTATAFTQSGGLVAVIGGIILAQIKRKELSPNTPVERLSIWRVLIVVAIIIAITIAIFYFSLPADLQSILV